MCYDQGQNNPNPWRQSTFSESSDRKASKLIIPKVKATNIIANDTLSGQSDKCQIQAFIKPQLSQYAQPTDHSFSNKLTTTTNNNNPPYKNTPNPNNSIKNFPKEQDLQKMTKKQLAQTYFEQFLRLKRQNQVLDKQLAFIRQERDLLFKKFNDLKDEQRNSDETKPKRQRRVASEIARKYNCPNNSCSRSYGSEGSLIQHIKIKHPEFYSTPEYFAFLSRYTKEDSS